MSETLEQKLKIAFEKAKKGFGYIPLKKVSLSSENPTAWIDMKEFGIYCNPEFITVLSKQMPEENAIEGLLDHEIGHYLYHPHSLQRVIKESITVKELDNGEEIRQFYDDVNNNLRVVVKKNDSYLPEIYKTLKPNSRVEKVLTSFYTKTTGLDFGEHKLDSDCKKALEQLDSIDFLGLNYGRIEYVKQDERLNSFDLLRFHSIMNPLFEKDKKEGQSPENKLGNSPQVKDYTGKQIRKALKEMIEKNEINPKEAKGFIKDIADKLEKDDSDSGDFPGGSFNDNPELFADRFVYESLAFRYSIKLKKTPLISKEGIYPTRHEKFEVGDDINSLDPFNSYGGKILPGLSNKWVKETISYHGKKEATPDLMILLDDSGSMPNPLEKISNAVLGSFAVANEYLKNNAKVSVGRFSDRTTMNEFSNDKYEVLNELLRFKNGNDTEVDLDEVKKISKGIHDTVVITDGRICNRDDVLEHLDEHAKRGSRSYLIEIGKAGDSYYHNKVKIIPINSQEDIGNIILDDLHKAA